uniref:Uncharacterized protein n=1 Tax=Picea glauca TaxID=3330 RepID=A0A117NGA1_PICGL|nr:hypothetical protein ABT39_MTgene1578 [Picea glauca]QHR88358.1 hypothetical protein Q903MT_gene2371 [Picea sitchensis]
MLTSFHLVGYFSLSYVTSFLYLTLRLISLGRLAPQSLGRAISRMIYDSLTDPGPPPWQADDELENP